MLHYRRVSSVRFYVLTLTLSVEGQVNRFSMNVTCSFRNFYAIVY